MQTGIFRLGLYGALAIAAVAQTYQSPMQQPPASSRFGSGQSTTRQPMVRTKVRRSHEAATVLIQTDLAKQALQRQDRQSAMNHINTALSTINQLQATAAAPRQGRNLVPIYSEIESAQVITGLNAAGQQQQTAEQPQIQRRGTAAREAGPAVREVAGGFTVIDLDLNDARVHLQAAKQALEQGQIAKAEAGLDGVQNGVVAVSGATDLPLVKARENLVLAQDLIQQGREAEAAAPLRAAANALQEYNRTSNSRFAPQAGTLASDIDTYSASLSQESPAQAQSRIYSWWNRVTDWVQSPSGR